MILPVSTFGLDARSIWGIDKIKLMKLGYEKTGVREEPQIWLAYLAAFSGRERLVL